MAQTLIDTRTINAYIFGTDAQKAIIEAIFPDVAWEQMRNELLAHTLKEFSGRTIEFQIKEHVDDKDVTIKYSVKVEAIQESNG